MRHAIGILLGLLLAPLLLGVAGWGFVRATQVGAALDPKSGEVLSGLAVLVAVGLVIGLLAAARWAPPSAALVVGLAYLGTTVYYVVAIDSFTKQLVQHGDLGEGVFGFVRTGTAALVGVLLLVSAAMPRRWAAGQPGEAADTPETYAELPPYQTTGYTTPGSAASGYGSPDYSTAGGTSGYSQPGYSQSGYSQSGYPQSGYSQSGYSQSGSESGQAQSGYGQPGYSAGSGQHRAPDSAGNRYYDEPTS